MEGVKPSIILVDWVKRSIILVEKPKPVLFWLRGSKTVLFMLRWSKSRISLVEGFKHCTILVEGFKPSINLVKVVKTSINWIKGVKPHIKLVVGNRIPCNFIERGLTFKLFDWVGQTPYYLVATCWNICTFSPLKEAIFENSKFPILLFRFKFNKIPTGPSFKFNALIC